MNIALITGASRGLGLALARALAARGWRLLLTARTSTPVEGDVEWLPGDVTDPAWRSAIAARVAAIGRLDVLINNAGALGPTPLPAVTDLASADLEAVLRTNVVAPLALIRALAPHMPAGSRILNVTSDAAVEAYPGWGAYGASKAALEQATRVLAAERPAWRVYAVDPGDMRTAMHQAAFPGEDISDRPLPEARVPGILRLIDGEPRSGRWVAADLCPAGVRA